MEEEKRLAETMKTPRYRTVLSQIISPPSLLTRFLRLCLYRLSRPLHSYTQIYLERSANLPTGLYILPSVISTFSFFKLSKTISWSTGPIFTICPPNKRYLFECCQSCPVFPIFKGRCHGHQFCVITDLFDQSRSISGSAGPIFTIFTIFGRYWIADDQSDLLFPIS